MPDLRLLKQRVGLERVLQSYGMLPMLHRWGARLVGPCPIHTGDNRTAFRADLDRNIWHCFTTCGGGDVVDIVRRIERCDHARAAWILAGLAHGECPPTASVSHPPTHLPTFRPFTFPISLDPRCDFLQQTKGISVATAARFEVGVARQSLFLRDTIAVRLHDLEGRPTGYCGRRLRTDEIDRWGKWRFPRDFPKRDTLYNAHRALPHRLQGVVVVECPWAVMRFSQVGFPSVVALLGTSPSPTQLRWLAQAPAVLLLLDGDPTGRRAAVRLAQDLNLSTAVAVLDLPDGHDPDDLPDSQLQSMIRLHPFFSLNQSAFGFRSRN
jgi:DNA primase